LQNCIPKTKNLTTHPTFTSLQQRSSSQSTDDEGTKQKWRHKERNCRRQMRNKTKVNTDKEVVAEDRWTDKHELLFLAKEMVL
jgi:hypothetical protein